MTEITYPGVTRENAIGQRVIAGYVPGFPEFAGVEFTVTEVNADSTDRWTNGLCLKGDFPNYPSPLWCHTWSVPAEDLSVTVKDLQDEVEKLTKLLEDERGRLRESQRYYSHDLTAINEMANAQADDQDWCSTYEDTLDRMNAALIGGFTLVGREFEWNVEGYEEVTVRVRRSWSGQARDEASAKEAAGEAWDENDLSDDDVVEALREYADPQYSSRDDSYRWTAEKV